MKVAVRKNRTNNIAVSIVLAFALVLVSSIFVLSRITAAAPATIVVSTTFDEDSHPAAGSGCSIYEASVAASTAAAYGGCSAGDAVDGSIIQVPAGTYPAAVDGFGDRAIIVLDDASLIGAGVTTILQGYSFSLEGSLTKELSNYTLSNVPGNPTVSGLRVDIIGNNKTVQNILINSTDSDQFYLDIYIGASLQAEQVNATVDSITTAGTIGGASVRCEAVLCTNPTVQNIEFDTLFDARISMATADSANLDSIALTAEYTAAINMGADASATNLTVVSTTDSGSAVLNSEGNSTIDGVTMRDESLTGVQVQINGSATSLANVTMSGPIDANGNSVQIQLNAGSMTNVSMSGYNTGIFNYAATSVTDGITSVAGEGNSQLSIDGEEIRNVLSQTSNGGTTAFYNESAGDILIDSLVLEELEPSVFGITASISPEGSATLQNVQVLSLTDSTALTVDATVVTIEGLKATNTMLQLTGSVTSATLGSLSLLGSPVFSLYAAAVAGSLTIEDSYMTGSDGGIVASGVAPGSSVTIRNTQIEDTVATLGPKAITFVDVETSLIDAVTISSIASPDQDMGTIDITNGLTHVIQNTSIIDGVGSLAVTQGLGAPAVDVTLRHVSINNSGVGPAYSTPGPLAAIRTTADTFGGVNIEVINSFIVGDNDYTACDIDPDAAMSVTASLTTSSSCVASGFTEYTGLIGDLVSDNLSDDTAEGPALGYADGPRFLQTNALIQGSVAIGFADESQCPVRDARGVVRDLSDGCDIGPYEFIVPSVTPPSGGGASSGGVSPVATSNSASSRVQNQPSQDVAVTNEDEQITEDVATPITTAERNPVVQNEQAGDTGVPLWIVITGVVSIVVIGGIAIRAVVVRR